VVVVVVVVVVMIKKSTQADVWIQPSLLQV